MLSQLKLTTAPVQTNSTRAKTLELHIQQRVAEELSKLQSQQSSSLDAARKRILDYSDDSDSSSSSSSTSRARTVKELLPGGESKEEKDRKAQTSAKVQQEIEKLRRTLGERKSVKDVPKDVENAYVELQSGLEVCDMLTKLCRRQDVISCLRLNDRKPLDCWKEVEIFKREVRKMEESYVASVL
jgi:MICOS complex subunit MIC19